MNKNYHLKVMHIASGDLWAGAEAQLFTLTKSLHSNLETTVCVVLMNYGELERRLRDLGIEVIVLDESTLNGVQILIQLVRVIQQIKPDIIHTHRVKENILGSVAAKIAGDVPNLRTEHGAAEHHPSWRQPHKYTIYLLDWFCGKFLQKKVIAVSSELAAKLSHKYPADTISIIENGVDFELIKDSAFVSSFISNHKKTKLNIGMAGRLVPVKRVDLFIQAASYLKVHYPDLDLNFHIFGDGPLLDTLQLLCRNLGIDTNVQFHGHCDDIYKKLQNLDALVLTSDHEGLPMILLEALVLEIPIIAHAVGGIPELLRHGKFGGLVYKHTPEGYAEGIHDFISQQEDRRLIVGNAKNFVEVNYSSKVNMQKIINEYLKLVR